jgi:hypothetical protein
VRAAKGSIVDEVEPQVRGLLKEFPDMPATVIAERIGWDRSLTVLKDRVRELRPAYAPADPASRTSYGPGGSPTSKPNRSRPGATLRRLTGRQTMSPDEIGASSKPWETSPLCSATPTPLTRL